MRFSRSHRRHHRHRMVVRRYKENLRQGKGAVNEVEWRFLNCRKQARTGRLCSCYICMNPRKKYGNSIAALTFQEIRCLDGMRVELTCEDLY